ncbi:MAG: lysine exporter LysO family protein [Firmicutes bacterium]|nr:lysine exporter LysO family protein [Bacillota bacterium]
MEFIPILLGVVLAGYFVGSRLRAHKDKMHWLSPLISIIVVVLLLVLGFRLGSNEEVFSKLGTIGIKAFILAAGGVTGSVLFVFIIRKIVGIDNRGDRVSDSSKNHAEEKPDGREDAQNADETAEGGGSFRMTVKTLVSLAVGMLAGFFMTKDYSPVEDAAESFVGVSGTVLLVILCVLLFFVGVEIGLEGTVVKKFKMVGWRIFLFPVGVIAGTLVVMLIMSMFIDYSVTETLAVGSGFGWFSLAPVLIAEYSAEVSALSLLYCVMRDVLGFIFVPVIAKKIGYVEAIAPPGASAMDVSLPIVERATNADIAVYSFVSGVIVSLMVPVLVPLFIAM